jgi:hypothetical protein
MQPSGIGGVALKAFRRLRSCAGILMPIDQTPSVSLGAEPSVSGGAPRVHEQRSRARSSQYLIEISCLEICSIEARR